MNHLRYKAVEYSGHQPYCEATSPTRWASVLGEIGYGGIPLKGIPNCAVRR